MKDFLEHFNDIKYINNLLKTTRFNNQLLIPIKIIKKTDFDKYELLIGNKKISTTSHISLDEGASYWAELLPSKESHIQLSNLKKKPDILQLDKFPLAFELDSILEILKLDNPSEYIKQIALEGLSDSDTKNEFEFFMNLLSSIEQKVLSMPFIYNNRYNILQLAPKKQSLDFFITTNNLGIIKGNILKDNNNFILNISIFFKNGYDYVSSHIKNLISEHFLQVNIHLEDELYPLFSFRQYKSFSV